MSTNHVHLFKSRRWLAVRRAVFKRDGWRCVECSKPGRLECDHVTPMQRSPNQDLWDMNGLQTLCRQCHIAKTRRENARDAGPKERAWRDLVSELL